IMEVGDLVDAALVGFDRREPVTIPPLHEAERWDDLQGARQGLLGQIRQSAVAHRYQTPQ
ncbi:MAG: SDR family oxidoreductase, partial [Pseudomonas sp.]